MLLLGPPGSGKSDLSLRLIEHGFLLVADDRVDITDGMASAPAALAGRLEVRGLGIVYLPYLRTSRLALAVDLADQPDRLPTPRRHPTFGLPLIGLRSEAASAAQRVVLALDWVQGRITGIGALGA